MADALEAGNSTERELQVERERSQKMKQENQVLLKKLHDVVGRYRNLQQQHQAMINGENQTTQSIADGASVAEGSASEAENDAVKKLEAEKHELIEKLKHVVGTCRIMQRQLQEAKEENDARASPSSSSSSLHHDAETATSNANSSDPSVESLQERVQALEKQVEGKETEKEEIVVKLKEVIARYQTLQQRMQEQMGEYEAAQSKIAALEDEFERQRALASNGDDALAIAIAQEEARTAVLREENERLKEQLTSIFESHQQQVQEQHEQIDHLEHENATLTKKMASLESDIAEMQQQQADSEQLYMEVASKLNHTLRENGTLQSKLTEALEANQTLEKVETADVVPTDDALRIMEAKLVEAEQEIEKKAATVVEWQQQCETLQSDLESGRAHLSEQLAKQVKNEEEMERLQKAHETVVLEKEEAHSAALAAAQEVSTKLEMRVGELQDEISAMRSSSKENESSIAIKEEIVKLQQKISTVNNDRDDLQGMLDQARHELEDVRSALDTETQRSQTKENEHEVAISKLEESLQEKAMQLSAVEAELNVLRDESASSDKVDVSELNEKLKALCDLQASTDGLRVEHDRLLKEYQAAVEKADELQSVASQLESVQRELLDAQNARSDALAQVEELTQQLTTMTLEHQSSLAESDAEMRSNLEAAQAKNAEQCELVARLQDEVQSLQSEVEELKTTQTGKSNTTDDAMNALNEQLLALRIEHEAAVTECTHLKNEIATSESRVTELLTQHATEMQERESSHEETLRSLEQDTLRLRGEVEQLQTQLKDAEENAQRDANEINKIRSNLESLPQLRREKTCDQPQFDEDNSTAFDALLNDIRENLLRVEEYEQKVSEMSKSTTVLEEKLASSAVDIDEAESRAGQYEQQMQAMTEQLQASSDERDQILQELEECKAQLLQNADVIDELTGEISLYEQKDAEGISAKSEARMQVENLTARLDEATSELEAIKAENVRMVFGVAKSTDSAVKLKQEVESLQVKLKDLNSQLEKKEERIKEQEEENAELIRIGEESSRLLKVSREEADTMTDQLEAAIQNLENLQQQVATSDEIARLQLEANAMSADQQREELEAELTSLRDQIATGEREKKELEELLDAGHAERQILEDKISSARLEATHLINDLEAQLREKTVEVDELISEIDQRSIDNQDLRAEIDQLKQELEEHRTASQGNLKSQLEQLQTDLQQRVENLTEENSAIKTEKESLAETILDLQNKLEVAIGETSSAHDLANTAEARLSELTADRTILSEELDQHKQTTIELQATITSVREAGEQRINELESRINELLETEQRLASQLEEQSLSLASVSQISDERAVQHNKLQAQLIEQATELDTLKNERDQLTSEKQVLNEQIGSLNRAIDEYHSSSQENSSEIEKIRDNFREQKEELEMTITTVQAEKLSLASDFAEIENKLAEALHEVTASQEAVKEAEGQVSELVVNQKRLVADLEDRENRIIELEESISATKRQNEQQVEGTSARIVELVEQKRVLNEQIVELRTSLDAVSSADMERTSLLGQVESLMESKLALNDERISLREQLKQHQATIAENEGALVSFKSKVEELETHNTTLKGYAGECEAQIKTLTDENEAVKTKNQQRFDDLEVKSAQLLTCQEQLTALSDGLRTTGEQLAMCQSDHHSEITALSNQMAEFKAEVESLQMKNARLTEQHEATMRSSQISIEEEWKDQVSTLEEQKRSLIVSLEGKDAEIQKLLDNTKELTTRYNELQEQHQKLQSAHETSERHNAASQIQIAELETKCSGANATSEGIVKKLEDEVNALRIQLDVEVEGANAARTALEVYKRRAATALKKATTDGKSSVRKIEEETTQLQQELSNSNARIVVLEGELASAKAQMEQAELAIESRVQVVTAQAAKDLAECEAKWQTNLSQTASEADSLRATLQAKAHLDDRIQELDSEVRKLESEIDVLKKELQQKSDVAREMLQVKDREIDQLNTKLDSALEATSAAVAAAASAQQSSANANGTTSSAPPSNERSWRRESAKSTVPGNGSCIQTDEHLLAAVTDVQSIALTTPSPKGALVREGLTVTREEGVPTQSLNTGEASKLTALERQVHHFQKKYEDTLALLEDANRQKKRVQDLTGRTSDGLNVEYLKNVVIKYIGSQNESEKSRLIPVIATVLHFSPQEIKMINDAHQKDHDESMGLLGGMFSLFGAAAPAPPPKPLAVPMDLDRRLQHPTGMITGGRPMDGEQDDEDDALTPLNPFASHY